MVLTEYELDGSSGDETDTSAVDNEGNSEYPSLRTFTGQM